MMANNNSTNNKDRRPKRPKKKSENVVKESVRIAVQRLIDEFIADAEAEQLQFPASFTKEQRAYVHEYVKIKGLKSKSFGKGKKVYKIFT
jgi:hypothetical protein